MAYIMTLFGIIMAVILFIYTLHVLESGKKTYIKLRDTVVIPDVSRNASGNTTENAPVSTVVRKNGAVQHLSDEQKDFIPKRICPLCRTELTRDEPLYAGNTLANGNRTILIYGCQYCYRTGTEKTDSSGA